MNPAFALALVAIAGLLAARLPHFTPPDALALIHDGHIPLVLLGILLGPLVGALDPATLQLLAPVTALAVGWWGARCGARFERRIVSRVPRRLRNAVLGEAAAIFVAVLGAVWLVARFIPPLSAAWSPRLAVALTLGAVAVTASPRAAARGLPLGRARARVAALETACGTVVAVTALGLLHPHVPFGGGKLGLIAWLGFGAASGVAIGLAFTTLTRLTAEHHDLPLALLALVVLGAGLGFATGVSPFLVCALAAAVMVNTSSRRRLVRTLLASGSRLADAVLFIAAGALVALPTWWVLAGALAIAAVRFAVKFAIARKVDPALFTVTQDGSAIALALNFVLCAGASLASAGAVVTTVVLAVALTQGAAYPLANLARLTFGAARPELSAGSSGD